MAILDTVKQALGIYYSEANKDAEISGIISGAKAYLAGAGWPTVDLADDAETPLAIQAITIYAKMAINTDPTELRHNPVLVSMIAQARVVPETVSVNENSDENTEEDGE